ncbi:MAG: DMT family transporter [Propionivibrio sp.]
MSKTSLTHARAVLLMVFVTLLWSTAGVITRQLDSAQSFEVTFWRSFFNALALTVILSALRGVSVWRGILRAPRAVWISGACWSVMFTAFMIALTLTSVANVLVIMALGPLVTALFARAFLGHRLPRRTWAAIAVAGIGIAWMYARQIGVGVSFVGSLVALAIPLAGAINFTTLQHTAQRRAADRAAREVETDMLPTVFIGAVISALATLPLAYPLQASPHDLSLLAVLGTVQLAIPCLLLVRISRLLSAPEIALLGLLEVVFGVTWTWLWADEQPSAATLTGGALVLGALVANELLALRTRRRLRQLAVPADRR